MKKILKILCLVCVIILFTVIIINSYVIFSTKEQILKETKIIKFDDVDCILILGAGIWGDSPSPMLQDRLDEGIKLYNAGISNKIVMSGDHGRNEYDEVNIMKEYAINNNIPSENVFMDHAGFSTYDSIYRVKEIFKAEKIIIVTQEYHLSRALYISNMLGIEAYGVGANLRHYSGQAFREIREILARNKDFIKSMLKPKATYLGDSIPVSGNGDVTNDKEYKFIAKIIEIYDSYIIVEPNSFSQEIKTSDKIKVNKITDTLDNLYTIGNLVEITYNGNIKESYPVQIDANRIVLVTNDNQK